MDKNFVVLVDDNDQQLGVMEKIEAHKKGVLHRAFSVLIFNDRHEMLLQQRAFSKYHSGGLWTNATCSHPMDGEEIIQAGKRRLFEEMGLTADLEIIGSFIYQCDFSDGLIEHEFDYVLKGFSNDVPLINREEVSDFKWMPIPELIQHAEKNPSQYTFWFLELIKRKFII